MTDIEARRDIALARPETPKGTHINPASHKINVNYLAMAVDTGGGGR